MNPAEWRQALADLARKAGAALAEDQADFLRIARTLLAVAPLSEVWRFGDLPSRSGFERLLAAEAWESAALALLPEAAGYLFSRSGDGCCMASLVLPECTEENFAEGDSPALAMTSALAAALVAAVVVGADEPTPAWTGSGAASDGYEIDEPWKLAPAVLH